MVAFFEAGFSFRVARSPAPTAALVPASPSFFLPSLTVPAAVAVAASPAPALTAITTLRPFTFCFFFACSCAPSSEES